ncbi:MAG: hypothetical protein JWO58_2215 [Chitinophagaceae bacterium]|nr:hypothetical protein [Chitinophagaceae bacterium]
MAQRELFLISIILFCSQCHPTKVQQVEYVNEDSVSIAVKLGITRVDDRIFSGVLYSLYPSTSDTLFYMTYRDGVPDGITRQFYTNHQLKELRYFSKGQKIDSCCSWWENGKKRSLAYFKNDEYEGVYSEWSEGGRLTKEMHYEAGHEEGSQKVWYDNRQIKSNYVIRKGRRYGLLGTKNCKNGSARLF